MSSQGSLHLLLDAIECTSRPDDDCAYEHGLTAGPSSSFPSSPTTALMSSPSRVFTSLHIPCEQSSSSTSPQPMALSCSSTSNSFSNQSTYHESSPKRVRKNGRKATRAQIKAREARRRELKERAINIYSVENSPVNEQQLRVLRMVYDEITPYPSDAWMVLLAIVIRRSFKQVKNWFSNERQKHKAGDVERTVTADYDNMRLRHSALQSCHDWSDNMFEEVVMWHHYRTERQVRYEACRKGHQMEYVSS